ncbi:hypothetical protein Rhow_002668 [Rhodococcus wratislaviensis]|uniref:Uncharacterized protein n=1 Tax=Rhodococcus wratislaviensis TaxID=44752 RepID=A0A402C693_RHOWR|nr:hypothetical protein Rhow_002668 [Rhodococcus wratislaviensis]
MAGEFGPDSGACACAQGGSAAPTRKAGMRIAAAAAGKVE